MRASIVVVGNELLAGHTTDANGPYLARELRDLGHRLVRLTIVPDDVDEIVDALRDASDRAQLVFVCGGLGPTQDDVTVEAVATFLHRPLVSPEEAQEQIRRIYRYGKEQGYLESDEVDEDAWKMAKVPQGGKVIRNDEGAAPGHVHTIPETEHASELFVLPGPPAELKSVFSHVRERGLLPVGDAMSVREVHLATFEAPVSSQLEAISDRFPEVEVGSYPQHGEKRVVVRLTGPEDGLDEVEAAIHEELEPLVIEGS